MQKLLLFIDKTSTFVGHLFSWFIVALTLLISWEVFSRYVLDNPHPWAFDVMIMFYGTLFMMAGAYTLAKNGHVRGDVLYGFFEPRTQATIDLILYIVFFIPGVIALCWAGYTYAAESWAINEHSNITADGPPIYPFKTIIPVAGRDPPAAGHRRDRALRDLPQAGRVALARGGRRGSRRRQAEGNGAREDRGHREARRARSPRGGRAMKIRKELWFGFTLMAIILTVLVVMTPWTNLTNGHLGLIMLALVVVTIMLGFPTAFTLMGMGVFFAWLSYRSVNPDIAVRQVLDLMVQRAYAVMSNDVLIAIPLFVFMGYLVERANLIEKLFKSLHLALARVPGSLAVATIVTCAIFATATGIVGAVVTLMGLLALPAMLRAGYSVQVSAGAITAGGCLGILIPPSVLLIVYGATAGVSVVQLYAGAFFPGIMLATLYVGYVIVLAKLKPHLMPPLPESERIVPLPPLSQALSSRRQQRLRRAARRA